MMKSSADMMNMNSLTGSSTFWRGVSWKHAVSMALIVTLWIGIRWVFWTGYAGADDFIYARYAWHLNHWPQVFWEFRWPAVILMRGCFLLFGPSELAACLPVLVASAGITFGVAWLIDWPRELNWQTQTSMVLACTLPIGVGFTTTPGVLQVAVSFAAVGTACLLKGGSTVRLIGSGLLALSVCTHEIMIFYVGILCPICLCFEWRRYWRPVLACAVIGVTLVAMECLAYAVFLHDPFARLSAAARTASVQGTYQFRFGGSALSFYLWPLKLFFLSKHFGFDLVLLAILGTWSWKQLDTVQRILLLTTLGCWFWLGYGTQVPWAYRPRSRSPHYYTMLILGVCAVMPAVVMLAWSKRSQFAKALLVAVVLFHVVCLAGGGRWGQRVNVSRRFLEYAKSHSAQVFLTDHHTRNEMLLVNGFKMPENVICFSKLTAPADDDSRSVGKQNQDTGSQLPVEPDAIMVNLERIENPPGPLFLKYVQGHGGDVVWVDPVRYKLLFLPFTSYVENLRFAIRSLGGKVLKVRRIEGPSQARIGVP